MSLAKFLTLMRTLKRGRPDTFPQFWQRIGELLMDDGR